MSAKAAEDTKIIKLPFSAFKIAFEKYPDAYLRVVQVVMIRLQRVTLLALHQYLGLGTELIANQHRGNKNLKYRSERVESSSTAPQEQFVTEKLNLPVRLNPLIMSNFFVCFNDEKSIHKNITMTITEDKKVNS